MLCAAEVHGAAAIAVAEPFSQSAGTADAGKPSPAMPCHGSAGGLVEHNSAQDEADAGQQNCPSCDASPEQVSGVQPLPAVAVGQIYETYEGFADLAYRASTPVGPDPPPLSVPIYLLNEVFLI